MSPGDGTGAARRNAAAPDAVPGDLPVAAVDDAVQALGLPPGRSLQVLNDGPEHRDPVVLVAGDRPFVLRFVAEREWSWLGHQHYSDELLAAQLDVVDWWVARRIPISGRLRATRARWAEVHAAGVRYRVVPFEWLRRGSPPGRLGPRLVAGVGRALGRLHDVSADLEPPPRLGYESLVGWSTQVAGELDELAGPIEPRAASALRQHADLIAERVEAVGPLPAEQVGHGDFNRTNVLLHRGAVTGIVDIGRVSTVHVGEELAQVVRWFGTRPRRKRRWTDPALVVALLDAYIEERASRAPRDASEGLDVLGDLAWLCAATSPRLYFRLRRGLCSPARTAAAERLVPRELASARATATELATVVGDVAHDRRRGG